MHKCPIMRVYSHMAMQVPSERPSFAALVSSLEAMPDKWEDQVNL